MAGCQTKSKFMCMLHRSFIESVIQEGPQPCGALMVCWAYIPSRFVPKEVTNCFTVDMCA
jgi:hypothetical protein